MKIAIACDHGGYNYKEKIVSYLQESGYEVLDCGTYSLDSCNYPEFAIKAAESVAKHEADFGVVICRSGEGVSMAANKVKGVRCGLAYNKTVAHLMREHNNANMIAFGADYFEIDQVKEMLHEFLHTDFAKGKHEVRVNMISDYENK